MLTAACDLVQQLPAALQMKAGYIKPGTIVGALAGSSLGRNLPLPNNPGTFVWLMACFQTAAKSSRPHRRKPACGVEFYLGDRPFFNKLDEGLEQAEM